MMDDLDHCPVCGRYILDWDMRGCEDDHAQRWCVAHLPEGHPQGDLKGRPREWVASVTLPDGRTETYLRQGTRSHFVVFGRDAVGVRRDEKPGVAQWCASAEGAFNVLPVWQRYGGEWTILPVEYTPAGHVGCSSGPQ